MSRTVRRGLGTRARRGAVLLLTLWLTAVLSLLAYSLLYELRMDTKLTSLHRKDMLASHLARTGVARAVADLTNDMIIDRSEDAQRFDCLGDIWAASAERVDVPYGGGFYSTLIEDEESKINLNKVSPQVLTALLRAMGVEEEEAKIIAGAIFDWRDRDDKPQTGFAESEREYYASLLMDDEGVRGRRDGGLFYVSKNDAFTSLDELLDVYGVTPELYYGYGRGERRRSRARRDARSRVTRPYEEETVSELKGLRDYLTIWTTGNQININTAPYEALVAVAVACGSEYEEARGQAAEVVSVRGDRAGNTASAFRSRKDFKERTRFPDERRGARVGFVVMSDTFTITSLGEYAGVRHSAQVMVRRAVDTYPAAPESGGKLGIWRDLELPPPYYKKLREDYQNPGKLLDPVVRALQWVEW